MTETFRQRVAEMAQTVDGAVAELAMAGCMPDGNPVQHVMDAIETILTRQCPECGSRIDETGRCEHCRCWWSAGKARESEQWMGDMVLRQSWIGPIT